METNAKGAEALLFRIVKIMRANLPAAVPAPYFDAFVRRNRQAMRQVLEVHLGAHEVRPDSQGGQLNGGRGARPVDRRNVRPDVRPSTGLPQPALPELWTPAQRTKANLEAMAILSQHRPEQLTDADRQALARYSGWGGLSIEKVKDRFPQGFPVPEAKALVHEYYSPSTITNEVARVIAPLLPGLAGKDGLVHALEPSAGIGRFIRAFEGLHHRPPMKWTAVELSGVSSRLLQALLPFVEVFQGAFERWLQAHTASGLPRQAFNLVVANPPYGPRGALVTEDPDKAYRVKQAYLYFLLRGLELLLPGGIGVYLIPSGFLTGVRSQKYRERILLTHHLMTAYRLPSESPSTKDPVFPGANLVTDLLFFRARGGRLAEVPAEDRFILDGRFYTEFPQLILGQVRNGTENDDHTKRPRRGYAVIGEFTGLPPLEERRMALGVLAKSGSGGATAGSAAKAGEATQIRGGVTREDREVLDLPEDLAAAVALGHRVDRFLADLSGGRSGQARDAWEELHRDLLSWKTNHGNPPSRKGLLELAHRGAVGAQRFLSAWTLEGELAESLATAPKYEPVYRGEPTLLGQADWLYRQSGRLTVDRLLRAFRAHCGQEISPMEAVATLTRAGWCLDSKQWEKDAGKMEVLPPAAYYTGDLWPKVDRCRVGLGVEGLYPTLRALLDAQLARLLATIKPAVIEDILDGLSPRESWIPVDVVEGWVNKELNNKGYGAKPVRLLRDHGLLQMDGLDYEALSGMKSTSIRKSPYIPEKVVWFLGWANHHLSLFRPPQPRELVNGIMQPKPLDEVRLEIARDWMRGFVEWLRAQPEAQQKLEDAYNRSLRGFVAPAYSGEPIDIARWAPDGPTLYNYQNQAVRRILANRCGLLAFDVGLGKTYAGLAIVARARQEGWARRPVVVVPNSIVWKWARDFKRCLPDYRVLVIGSKRKMLGRGDRRGRIVAEPDTPAERAAKWSTFQAGRADVALLTYSALGRTRVAPDMLYDYVEEVTAIQRQVKLGEARRQGKETKSLTERAEATLKESTEAWIAEHLEANANWQYDPGIEWHALGIDLLVVDESQNFKNLFLPEEREGGLPDAMGGSLESKRSWQLDFRCASARKHTGGTGVVLLSATPAKNGPVEFYNAVHLISPAAWSRVGIHDPEAFIDRYCAFEARTAQTPEGKLTVRQACVAFKNLHELRDVAFRYADFKTAEDVGLKIPDARNREHRVDLDDDQIEAIREAWAEIRELKDRMKELHGEAAAGMREALRLKMQGVAMRVDLIAIHPELPGSAKLKKRQLEAIDPHSGKIDEVVREILATDERACSTDDPAWCLNCGHIVFCENVAVHYWVRKALVEAGIPEKRIAILNAVEARDPETRQQIAEQFNGIGEPGDEVYEPPAYDVVLANSVAYEGVDLQRRTCAIHHLDLPWDPATLQQRNGRGVRQGNAFESVTLHYYLGRPSGDGRRLSLIDKKRSWMASLVKGQDRVTNNPAASINVSIEDLLLDIVPVEERERVLREREEEAKRLAAELARQTRLGANRVLAKINARFRRAEEVTDPAEAGRLRDEGEQLLAELAKVDAGVWPWLEQARRVRTEALWVPEEGPPLWAGLGVLRYGRPAEIGLSRRNPESGQLQLGVRSADQVIWEAMSAQDVDPWVRSLEATGRDLSMPGSDHETAQRGQAVLGYGVLIPTLNHEEARAHLQRRFGWYMTWPELGWHLAPPRWVSHWWEVLGAEILKIHQWREGTWAPVVSKGKLMVVKGGSMRRLPEEWVVIPPTEAGWRRYLELAPASGLKLAELREAARYWWGRSVPRGVLGGGAGRGEWGVI